MSAWISDYKQMQNYSGTGDLLIYAYVECDDLADLPTATQFTGFVIDKESIAHVINGNQKYMLNSQGVWMLQEDPMFSGVYTKSEIDDMISDIDDIQTAQAVSIRDLGFAVDALEQANNVTNGRLSVMVDQGCKNLVNNIATSGVYNNVTCTVNEDRSVTLSGGPSSQYFSFRICGVQGSTTYNDDIPIPRGTYKLTGLPSTASATTCRYILGLYDSSGGTRTSTSIYEDYEFEITTDTARFDLTVYFATNANFTTPVTYYPMITEAWKYVLSQNYVPYSPSNADLAKMILSQ